MRPDSGHATTEQGDDLRPEQQAKVAISPKRLGCARSAFSLIQTGAVVDFIGRHNGSIRSLLALVCFHRRPFGLLRGLLPRLGGCRLFLLTWRARILNRTTTVKQSGMVMPKLNNRSAGWKSSAIIASPIEPSTSYCR